MKLYPVNHSRYQMNFKEEVACATEFKKNQQTGKNSEH